MTTSVTSLVGALLLAFLLSGCDKLETNLSVNDDGSGHLEYVVAVDTEAILNLAQMSDELPDELTRDDICGRFVDDVAALNSGGEEQDAGTALPSHASAYEEGDYCGISAMVDIPPSANLGDEVERSFALGADTVGDWAIVRNESGGWDFSYEGIEAALEHNVGAGTAMSAAGDVGAFDSVFAQMAAITYDISLPGYEVVNGHNATSVSSDAGRTTFSWHLDGLNVPDSIRASTTASPPTADADAGAPDELALTDGEKGHGGLLLGLAALIAVIAIGGALMIGLDKPPAVDTLDS